MKSLAKALATLLFIAFSLNTSAQINLDIDKFTKTYQSTPDAQLLDVRTPGEWSKGKLKNSTCINYLDESFAQNIAKLDKDKPVFVYCAVGGRSAKATKVLKKAGFKNIYNLTGAGYSQLKIKGL